MTPMTRALLISVLLILIAFVGFSYLTGTAWSHYPRLETPRPVATTGAMTRTRERVDAAAITSKIKAKMMLDDHVDARAINVTTNGSMVTLTGTVGSVDEHDRAINLARDTAGVTEVIDQLMVSR